MQTNLVVDTSSYTQVVDITDRVSELCDKKTSMINVFVRHSTCAITTVSMDPGLDQDLLEAVWNMIPQAEFRHGRGSEHARSHIISSLLGPSLSLPAKNGELLLGQWQRIVLVELDGPKSRQVVVSALQ